VKFLNENAFTTPTWGSIAQSCGGIEPPAFWAASATAQNTVLTKPAESSRFARMVEQEALDGSAAYTPADFLVTVRKGLWKEWTPAVKVDGLYRGATCSSLSGPG